MGPIDYSGGLQPSNPMQRGLQAFAVGDAIRQKQLAEQQAQQAAIQKAQQERALQDELSALASRPGGATVADYVSTMTRFPFLAEKLKAPMEAMNAEQQRKALDHSSQVLAALSSKQPEVAARMFEERAQAAENSGDQQGASKARAMAEQARTNPQALMPTFTGLVLSLPGGDKVVEGMTKQSKEAREAAAPLSVAEGVTLLDPVTKKPVYTNEKTEVAPAAVKEYEYAQAQGYKGSFQQFEVEKRKAGATNIALPKIDIKVGESTAAQVGPMMRESREKAVAGVKLVDSGNRILEAVRKGNVIVGPLASVRLRTAQAADLLNIGGENNAEKIKNTRATVRAMAEQAVAARSQLGGQAQISNSEQELLTKATSGDVNDLTVREVAQIAGLNIRLGTDLYAGHESMVEALKASPGTANLVPYYKAPAMPKTDSASAKPASEGKAGWGIKQIPGSK